MGLINKLRQIDGHDNDADRQLSPWNSDMFKYWDCCFLKISNFINMIKFFPKI